MENDDKLKLVSLFSYTDKGKAILLQERNFKELLRRIKEKGLDVNTLLSIKRLNSEELKWK